MTNEIRLMNAQVKLSMHSCAGYLVVAHADSAVLPIILTFCQWHVSAGCLSTLSRSCVDCMSALQVLLQLQWWVGGQMNDIASSVLIKDYSCVL